MKLALNYPKQAFLFMVCFIGGSLSTWASFFLFYITIMLLGAFLFICLLDILFRFSIRRSFSTILLPVLLAATLCFGVLYLLQLQQLHLPG